MRIDPFPARRAQELQGDAVCPPDKSVTHRSVIFAAMATGESFIESPLLGADCRSTMGVFRALGCEVTTQPATGGSAPTVRVQSPGWSGWRSPTAPLDFGNSGTTARLLAGVFAATPGLFVTAFGDQSLSKRPMGRVVRPLRAAGAQIAGRDDGNLLPLAITGQSLRPLAHTVDKASAQVKSALLLAGLRTSGKTTVRLPRGGRDHTERMLQGLGATLSVAFEGKDEVISVEGPFTPAPRRYKVPGDPSSAAFLAVLGALASGRVVVRGVLDNPTRTGFLTVLERLGVPLERGPLSSDPALAEPMRDVTLQGGAALRGVDVEPELAPSLIDEIPILAVCAAFAQGPSRFRGLGELRVKESDRLAKTIELVTLAGGAAHAEGDDLVLGGGLGVPRAFHYETEADHRLAMAAAVLAKFAEAPCTIDDPAAVDVSFPGFFDVLAALG